VTGAPPNLAALPCAGDPAAIRAFAAVLPCRCSSRALIPVCDCERDPTYAVACDGCGAIEGDAPDLPTAVVRWNSWTETGHAWVPTENDDEAICCLCGATPHTAEAEENCPDADDPFITDDGGSTAPE
jgi:hypothetical protein